MSRPANAQPDSDADKRLFQMHLDHIGGRIEALLLDQAGQLLSCGPETISRNMVYTTVSIPAGTQFRLHSASYPGEPLTAICALVTFPPSLRPGSLASDRESSSVFAEHYAMDAFLPHTQRISSVKTCEDASAGPCSGIGWFVAPDYGEQGIIQLEVQKAVRDPEQIAGYSNHPLDTYYGIAPLIIRFKIVGTPRIADIGHENSDEPPRRVTPRQCRKDMLFDHIVKQEADDELEFCSRCPYDGAEDEYDVVHKEEC
ncbi:hypothetical protein C8F01DRAFT_1242884 [Mycena amicta]|nr:hypothetical protein C8F01DRAFT_1242884 [Mycena amicta]